MDPAARRAGRPAAALLKFDRGDAERILDAMAREVRAHFAQHRRYAAQRLGKEPNWGLKAIARWDGGEDAHGKTFAPIWPRIARFCAEQEVDLRLFIEAQFADHDGDLLRPDMLLRDSALAKYREYVRGAEQNLRWEWNSQFDYFRMKAATRERTLGESEGQAAYYVLADVDNDLTALFRYCLASLGENGPLKDRFRVAALMQYAFRRYAYDRAWAAHLPADLRRDAATFLAQFSRKA